MIQIHIEGVEVPVFNQELFCSWLEDVVVSEGAQPGDIQFVFCSDDYLLEINKKYLNHDYFTDIITFDYTLDDLVSGDLFVSIDRVSDNAADYNCTACDELLRVCVHGVLHLLGYKDKTPADTVVMRSKEDFYLARYVSRGT
jgi:probable rRNA maturation factor